MKLVIAITLVLVITILSQFKHDTGESYISESFLKKPEFKSVKDQDKVRRDTVKYKFVGADKCGSSCHNTEELGYQYDIWKKTSHSRSFEALKSEKAIYFAKKAHVRGDPSISEKCLNCHITGYGLSPESFTPTYTKEEGVTCEACHKEEYETKTQWTGKHRPLSRGLQPDEKTCKICHLNSVHRVRKFNYEENLSKITHLLPRYK